MARAGLNEAAGWVKRARWAEALAEMPAVAGAQTGAEGLSSRAQGKGGGPTEF